MRRNATLFPIANYANLISLLSACRRERNLRLGSALHAAVIQHPTLFEFTDHNHDHHRGILVVWNSLISMYSKCGKLSEAAKMFDRMEWKDTVTWNSMISGFLRKGDLATGFGVFREMRRLDSCCCDHATLTTIVSTCGEQEMLYAVEMMHSVVLLNGFGPEVSVGNALTTAYFKCGCSQFARRMFVDMPERNVITWTAMVSGFAQSELYKESLSVFSEMQRLSVPANSLTYSSALMACSGTRAVGEGRQVHALAVTSGIEHDLCTQSALMDMYSKCGFIEDACRVFESTEKPDRISYTVILVGLAQNGLEEKAFHFFVKMVAARIELDADIVSAVLGAFGGCAPFVLGRQIHSLVIKKRFDSNIFVGNGLINMYSKCGDLGDTIKVFDRMVQRNSVSWNSMIAAFARHGLGHEALQLYETMRWEGAEPTDVTFLSLLHACSHAGAVEKGMEFFRSMSEDYRISPRMEHYACVVDMLGRAARLDEARTFIESLPEEPNALIWQSLLGACGIYGNLEMGEYAAEQLLLVAPECPAGYVLLANICSSEGSWKERARLIKKMRKMGVKKETGMSWIEITGDVHSFVVDDRIHRQAEAIYEALDQLIILCSDEGYVPDMRFMQCELDL